MWWKRGGCHGLAFTYGRAGNARRIFAELLQDLVTPRIRQGLGNQANLPLWRILGLDNAMAHCAADISTNADGGV